MKKRGLIAILLFVFTLSVMFLLAQAIQMEWHTFIGSTSDDWGLGIAHHSSGNLYVCGQCSATWGSPVNPHSGSEEGFVFCLDSSGNLLWNTFLGCSSDDIAYDIVVDSSQNTYVIGYSEASWGSPVNAHSGLEDIFVAKLDSSGNLVWNTFLGSYNQDFGGGIALDTSGYIHITGYSYISWGTPVNVHSGGWDAFVAKLDSNGNLVWNTFMGSGSTDYSWRLDLDGSGNVYTTGQSYGSWGTPVNAHSGNTDIFVAKLDSSGNRLWNTFLGSGSYEYNGNIIVGTSGNVFVAGRGNATWGSPVNAHTGGYDGFAACLNNSGSLVWNTFFGSSGSDGCKGMVVDGFENLYITGDSTATWGIPINPFASSYDAFVLCLNNSGSRLWNTFIGGTGTQVGVDIVRSSSGIIHVTGESNYSWGSPVNAYSGSNDAFVATLSTHPVCDIKANGSDGPISITESDTLQARVTLGTYGLSDNVDFWLAYRGPSGWVHYNNSTKKWESGLGVTHQGPLMNLNNKKVFQSSLAPGNYTFYFGVDMNMDGKVTKSSLYKDEVQVTVTSN